MRRPKMGAGAAVATGCCKRLACSPEVVEVARIAGQVEQLPQPERFPALLRALTDRALDRLLCDGAPLLRRFGIEGSPTPEEEEDVFRVLVVVWRLAQSDPMTMPPLIALDQEQDGVVVLAECFYGESLRRAGHSIELPCHPWDARDVEALLAQIGDAQRPASAWPRSTGTARPQAGSRASHPTPE